MNRSTGSASAFDDERFASPPGASKTCFSLESGSRPCKVFERNDVLHTQSRAIHNRQVMGLMQLSMSIIVSSPWLLPSKGVQIVGLASGVCILSVLRCCTKYGELGSRLNAGVLHQSTSHILFKLRGGHITEVMSYRHQLTWFSAS